MANEKMPWEMDLGIPTNTVQSAPEQATAASSKPQVANPWEMDLGAARQPVKVPKASPVSKLVDTPPDWSAVNQQYAAGQGQRDQDRLFTLQTELSKETNPTNRAAIQREIASVPSSQTRSNEGWGASETDKAKRKELEALPTITGKELVASGFGTQAGRAEWESKMKAEFTAATKGMTAAQKDKYFSNYQFYAKNKYPKQYQMYSFLSRNDDLNDHAISFLDSSDLKLSFTEDGLEGASGFVYNDKGDRAFLAPSANIKTVVHEGEHLKQQKDFEKSKFKSPHLAASDSSTPVGKLRKLTEKFKDDPAIKSVFSADNSYESSTEWLANLSGFMRTGIPQGKSWSDTPFYKKLVKEVGDKDAQTYLLDALLTLQRADYTKNR